MLVIRQQQVLSLREETLKNFENKMVEHFSTEFAPRHCKVIGENGVREVIKFGMKNAERYGFTNRGPVQLFIEMMFMFGGHFDTDPQYVWASEILNDAQMPDQMERSEKLYDETLIYLNKVAGEKREHVINAFRQIEQTNFEEVLDLTKEIEPQVKVWLKRIYPQKYEFTGEEKINQVIERGKSTAAGFQITSASGRALCIGLSFAMGHGFAEDPLFPWINLTLTDEKFEDPNEKAERLYRKVKIYVEKAVKNLDGK